MKDSKREGQTDISTGLMERKLIEDIQFYLSHARVKCYMCTRCTSFYFMSWWDESFWWLWKKEKKKRERERERERMRERERGREREREREWESESENQRERERERRENNVELVDFPGLVSNEITISWTYRIRYEMVATNDTRRKERWTSEHVRHSCARQCIPDWKIFLFLIFLYSSVVLCLQLDQRSKNVLVVITILVTEQRGLRLLVETWYDEGKYDEKPSKRQREF